MTAVDNNDILQLTINRISSKQTQSSDTNSISCKQTQSSDKLKWHIHIYSTITLITLITVMEINRVSS